MHFAEIITILIILLLVATSVALLTRWIKIPYAAGLVVAGLAITELLPRRVGMDPALILNLFLPILLFDAALNTDISRLRSTVKPIALLAGPGVILASVITSVILKYGLALPWISALLAGVILAITDTVAVISVFKEVAVPSRLSTIVEGESLFNDGMALVIFSLLVKMNGAGSLSILDGMQELFVVLAGGSLIGLSLGYLSAGLFVRSDDSLSGILLTLAVALGAFQLGHWFGVSGVVAVVIAGLMLGSIGLSGKVQASTRLSLLSFWESAAFIVNSFIFLLIGLEVNLSTLWQTLPAVLLAFFAYQVGRLLSVYPLLTLLRWLDRPIPWRWLHVLFLGNIKGSLSMALAFSIPVAIAQREQVIAIVFGSVLLSLLGQGISLPWIVKRLRLSRLSSAYQQLETLQAQLISAKAAQDELENLLKSGILPKAAYEELRAGYQVQVAGAERELREIYNRPAVRGDAPTFDRTKRDNLNRRLLFAQKDALDAALRKGILSEEIVREKLKPIDEQLVNLEDE
jgi:monovalent cation:H+ antiporter, CPA1 family